MAQLIESRLNLQKAMPVDDFFRHPTDIWVVALFGVLVAPVCEEIFFSRLPAARTCHCVGLDNDAKN